MNRRDFFKRAFVAGTSAAIAHTASNALLWNPVVKPGESEDTTEQKDSLAIKLLMEKYGVPTAELAHDLYQAMLSERADMYAGGAAIGSVTRSIYNEVVFPQDRRTLFYRARNVLIAAGFSQVISYPVIGTTEELRKNPLTSPETLREKYGLPPEKADLFCEDFKNTLSGAMFAGAGSAVMLLELFFPSEAKPSSTNTPGPAPG